MPVIEREPDGVAEARDVLLSGGRVVDVYAHVGSPGGHNNDRVVLTMESGASVSFDAYAMAGMTVTADA